jgi:hypothetical protein
MTTPDPTMPVLDAKRMFSNDPVEVDLTEALARNGEPANYTIRAFLQPLLMQKVRVVFDRDGMVVEKLYDVAGFTKAALDAALDTAIADAKKTGADEPPELKILRQNSRWTKLINSVPRPAPVVATVEEEVPDSRSLS